jgi:hypothetical protein
VGFTHPGCTGLHAALFTQDFRSVTIRLTMINLFLAIAAAACHGIGSDLQVFASDHGFKIMRFGKTSKVVEAYLQLGMIIM